MSIFLKMKLPSAICTKSISIYLIFSLLAFLHLLTLRKNVRFHHIIYTELVDIPY